MCFKETNFSLTQKTVSIPTFPAMLRGASKLLVVLESEFWPLVNARQESLVVVCFDDLLLKHSS